LTALSGQVANATRVVCAGYQSNLAALCSRVANATRGSKRLRVCHVYHARTLFGFFEVKSRLTDFTHEIVGGDFARNENIQIEQVDG
jgi:hypothetical protein